MNISSRQIVTILLMIVAIVTQVSFGNLTVAAYRGSLAGAKRVKDAPAMFRGGPNHVGFYGSDSTSAFGGLQWRVQTGGAIHSSPTVANGVTYIGSEDGFLYAIDSVSGDVRWKFNAESPISSSAAIADGMVFVGGRDGRLWAVSEATGKSLWMMKTGPDMPLAWGHESGDFITSSPTVIGDQLLFGSGDGYLYCVARQTGNLQWRFKTGGRVRSSPAADAGVAYIGSQDGQVYAVDLGTGSERWHYATEGAGLDSGKFGYDRRTVQSSPAVVGGTVYVGARDGFLYALSAADGHLIWRFDHQISWVNSSPAVIDGQVYAASSDGKFVQSVDARSGKENWRLSPESLFWSSPAISGNVLYIGGATATLFAVDRRSGKELWRYRVTGKIHSSPSVADGRVFFGSEDGGVYCVNVAHGPELKRAVFWDETFAKESTVQHSEIVRDYFKNRGYELLNSNTLAAFLNARISDRTPSVIVFATDRLPDPVAADLAEVPLFRRYLDAGGKVVWPGLPPLLWPYDVKQGGRDLEQINRAAAEKLLNVGFQRGNFDPLSSSSTSEGQRWGVNGWWLSNWSADSSPELTILARDAQGLAAAWVRRYGGPVGTGFVRIPLTVTSVGEPSNLITLQTAAEYRPTD